MLAKNKSPHTYKCVKKMSEKKQPNKLNSMSIIFICCATCQFITEYHFTLFEFCFWNIIEIFFDDDVDGKNLNEQKCSQNHLNICWAKYYGIIRQSWLKSRLEKLIEECQKMPMKILE